MEPCKTGVPRHKNKLAGASEGLTQGVGNQPRSSLANHKGLFMGVNTSKKKQRHSVLVSSSVGPLVPWVRCLPTSKKEPWRLFGALSSQPKKGVPSKEGTHLGLPFLGNHTKWPRFSVDIPVKRGNVDPGLINPSHYSVGVASKTGLNPH